MLRVNSLLTGLFRTLLGKFAEISTCVFRVLIVTWLLAAFGMAQESSASLNGTVRDVTGAVIPGAHITLRNTKSGVEQTTISTDTGRYVFVAVSPGEYTVSNSTAGYAPVTQGPFTLVVNQTSTFDFELQPGTLSQTIAVESSVSQIDTTTSALGTAITTRQVDELPLNGRQFTQLLALTPGASPANVSQNSGGGQSNALGTVLIPAVNGQQNRSNYFMLDGINDSEVVFSSFAVSPIVDDIQEFKVQSHNDEAQFGYVTGGIVNVVTKSGSNTYHGGLWEFLRNDALDARNAFDFAPQKVSLRQNQFGANVGGPVIIPHIYNGKNKTFIFGSYEGFRNITGAGLEGLAITPTQAQLSGDLSSLSTPIFNPFTTRPDPAHPGQFLRDPFPGNRIPASLLDTNMVKFAQDVFPLAGPAIFNQYNTYSTQKNSKNQDEYNIRADEYLNQNNIAWFRWSASNQSRLSPSGFQGLNDNGTTDAKNFGASYLHTFSPTTILSVSYGHNSIDNADAIKFAGLNASTVVQQTGLAPSFACGYKVWGASFDCLVPNMNIAGFIGGGETTGGATPLTSLDELKADFSHIHGNHTFKLGYDFQWQYFYSLSTNTGAGFAPAQTGDPQNLGNTGSALASFLLGVPDNATRRVTVAQISNQVTTAAYVQDSWKATSRLTVNAGLRWEMGVWPKYGTSNNGTDAIGELDLNNGTYILQRSVPSCADAGAPPCIPGGLPQPNIVVSKTGKLWNTDTANFAPRLGLAYRLNDKTSVHASFGIFYDNFSGINQTVQGIGGDWPAQTQVLASNLNAVTTGKPTVTAENPLAGTVAAFPPATPFQQVEWYRDPNQKNPYSEQWQFGFQRAVAGNNVVELNYVGSHSSRLTVGSYANAALTPGPGDPAARSPYPYITPTYYDRSVGRSSYNALQFKWNRQFSHGLQYLISYTWSKSLDIGCSGFFGIEGCSIQDEYNLNQSRSVSGFDLTHVFSASWVYHVPEPRTSVKTFNYVAGNWQLNGIFTATSGLPYTMTVSGDIANIGISGYERLNLVGNPNLSNPQPGEWFNTSAFAVPAAYTFGNLGRNTMRGDNFVGLDLSAVRDFPFGEQRRLQFRADLFNAPNHTVWGNPVSEFTNPQFGQVTSTRSTERQIQLALKFYF